MHKVREEARSTGVFPTLLPESFMDFEHISELMSELAQTEERSEIFELSESSVPYKIC